MSHKRRPRSPVPEALLDALAGHSWAAQGVSRSPAEFVAVAIAWLRVAVAERVAHLSADPRLQQLEASWFGLAYLAAELEVVTGGDPDVARVDVLPVSRAEALDELTGSDPDQGGLWHNVVEVRIGQFGATPAGLLLADYELGPDDEAFATGLMRLGSAACVPVVAAASEALVAADTEWDRTDPDARFLALTTTRVRVAGPAGPVPTAAGYAFAAVVARSVARTQWFGEITGEPGRFSNLPQERRPDAVSTDPPRPPLGRVFLAPDREQLVARGLLPIAVGPRSRICVFTARNLYLADGGAVESDLGHMLTACRALQLAVRHLQGVIGTPLTPAARSRIKAELAELFVAVTVDDDSPAPDVRVRFPLRAVEVHLGGRGRKLQVTLTVTPHPAPGEAGGAISVTRALR